MHPVTATLRAPQWSFVPPAFDAGDLAHLEPLFARLEQRNLPDAATAEAWLRDESELLARIGAEQARRYVAMTCDTEDTAKKQRYLDLAQNDPFTLLKDMMERSSLMNLDGKSDVNY